MSLIIVNGPQGSGKTFMVLKKTQGKKTIWIKSFIELSWRLMPTTLTVVYDEFTGTPLRLKTLKNILAQPFLKCKSGRTPKSFFRHLLLPTLIIITTDDLSTWPEEIVNQAQVINHKPDYDIRKKSKTQNKDEEKNS